MTAFASTTAPSDLLQIADLTAVQLYALLDLADSMRSGPTWWTAPPSREAVACVCDEPSMFEVAAQRLGMHAIVLRPDALWLDRDEALDDAARLMSSFAAAIVVRASAQVTVERLAAAATVPVVNASTDDHDPCQALADLLTVRRRFGYLEGIRLAYVGAGDNLVHSLMEAGALAGMHVNVATPRGREPRPEVTKAAIELAAVHGGAVNVMHDPRSAADDAQVVYTEDIDDALMRPAEPGAVVMQRLPVHGGLEAFDGPSSIVSEQAANRLPTEQAILHALVGRTSLDGRAGAV
jgi:ornithine carbamoyltransferase